MKANELMIGDLVLTLDSIHKEKAFAQIDAIEEGQHSILVTRECSNWFVDIDWIEPIPLTPEILEKNGFVVESRYCYGKSMLLQYCELVDGLWIDITGENSFEGKLEYVHQLQHALRLCEIKKEIKLEG